MYHSFLIHSSADGHQLPCPGCYKQCSDKHWGTCERPTLDLRGKEIMDKYHHFPRANSLEKHFIGCPAEGQLPMVVTYSVRLPCIDFPSFCISLAFVFLTPTLWDHFPNKLPIHKSLAQLSCGGTQVKTTWKVLSTVPDIQ